MTRSSAPARSIRSRPRLRSRRSRWTHFASGLPKIDSLTATLLGKSDAGREHWELTITDPAVPTGQKRKSFWHARAHAHETFSSFAMEGLVGFMLSDEAADFRRRYVSTLHPMTNPDGVAQGFEYRGGYDFPKPRGTTPRSLRMPEPVRPAVALAEPGQVYVVYLPDYFAKRKNRVLPEKSWVTLTELPFVMTDATTLLQPETRSPLDCRMKSAAEAGHESQQVSLVLRMASAGLRPVAIQASYWPAGLMPEPTIVFPSGEMPRALVSSQPVGLRP